MVDQYFISNKSDVKKFLKELKTIINSQNFDHNNQFVLSTRKNDISTSIYSNFNTLMLFGYDISDVIEELNTLTYENYKETILDSVGNTNLLYVFKKIIKDYIVYIKVGITVKKTIICKSFHISNEK